MLKFVKNHTLLFAYFFVFAGLFYGVYFSSGTKYLSYLWIYFAALIGFYALFSLPIIEKLIFQKLHKIKFSYNGLKIEYLVYFVLAAVLVHLIYLKGSPAIQAAGLNYIEDVAILRNKITDNAPTWLSYLSSFTIRAFLPFLVLALLVKNKKILYWIVLLVAVFYSFSLMQKSYIVGVLLPVMIFAILSKKWLLVIKYFAFIIVVVFGLSFVSNPAGGSNPNYNGGTISANSSSLQKVVNDDGSISYEEAIKTNSEEPLAIRIVYGLVKRLTVVPGWVVSGWFETIPSKMPFLNGDGYRIIAKLKGHTFHNYSSELYPILQPAYAAQGLTGTVNVASFMYEYANFGTFGLVLSGFILAILFLAIEALFKDDFKYKISINIFLVLLLSSSAITTLLFSGGWGAMILMYFLFLKNKTSE